MYQIGTEDQVFRLENVPQSDVGAPLPLVLSDERTLLLAYVVAERDPEWDDTEVKIVLPSTPDLPIAIVRFKNSFDFRFGPPNDEAFSGHPLAERGLRPYSAAEVRPSSWVRALERMNSVHPFHDPAIYDRLRHFIFAFHDSTLECVARSFETTVVRGSMQYALDRMSEILWSTGA